MGIENTKKLIDQRELVALGTGKHLTFQVMRILYGLNLEMQDPEEGKPDKDIFPEIEPEGSSFEAVLFKLLRLKLLIDDLEKAIAVDIGYQVDSKEYTKRVRTKEEEETYGDHQAREALQVAYLEYGDVPFEPVWTAVFGGLNQSQIRSGELKFTAKVDPIPFEKIEQYLNPRSNAGINLLEYLKDTDTPIYLIDSDGVKIQVDIDLAIQLIVYKVPTLPIIEKILFSQVERGEELFATVALGLADLDDPNI